VPTAAWLAPLAVLIAKLRREERHLLQRFGDDAACRRSTRSPVPPIF
jgi:protein-S-isoprenylcysteine O-methyltransferase Ste14